MVAEFRFRFRCVLVLAMVFPATAGAAGATTDTRLLGKPHVNNNDRKECASFRFVLKSYVGAPSASMKTKMSAEESQLPVMLPDLGQDSCQEANTLLLALSPVLSGSSLQLLMNTESGNGFEGWRKLCAREEPATGTARVAQLTSLLRASLQGGRKRARGGA